MRDTKNISTQYVLCILVDVLDDEAEHFGRLAEQVSRTFL